MIEDTALVNDWHPVARSEDVPADGVLPVRLLGEDMVLWRAGGRLMAWKDLCIHRGTRLSMGHVERDQIVCPYHGWRYDPGGRCTHIPAHPDQTPPTKARAQTYQAREQYGLIWVSPGEPPHDIPAFPVWADDTFRKIPCGPYPVQASAPRVIENFVDVAHFPILHAGLLGDPQHAHIEDFEVTAGPDGIAARDVTIWQPNPDGTGQGAAVSYTYHIPRPFTVYFRKTSGGPSFAMFFAVTPVDPLQSVGWGVMAMNYGFDTPAKEVRAFEDRVFAQDVPVIESQRPELLPLDLQAELHLRSDRIAIAYRRWLRALGLSFGTA